MPDENNGNIPDVPTAPPWVNNLQWAFGHVRKNWDSLKRPGVIIIILFIGIGTYYLGRSKSDDVLAVREERITFLADELTAYKDRLKGASPDDAAKQLRELQSKLDHANERLQLILPDNPRHLKEQEKQAILKNIDRIKSEIKTLFVYAWLNGDATEYANEFIELLKANNIPIVGPIYSPCKMSERGILVGLPDPVHPSDSATDFTNILKDAGLHVSHTLWVAPIPTVLVPRSTEGAPAAPALAVGIPAPSPSDNIPTSSSPPTSIPIQIVIPDFDLFICGGEN